MLLGHHAQHPMHARRPYPLGDHYDMPGQQSQRMKVVPPMPTSRAVVPHMPATSIQGTHYCPHM